ncbi:alginate export family protein [Methylomonas albis]|uniref:Alginate export family protein n=1 Tax=Methylomonas albis TaxID=1854563 RepID=A0ABR9D1E5_9GAMM|nr:alginate export family protein [Methylomonas albis]MBD9356850.1 alginate export family protein [Methylomonas albis]
MRINPGDKRPADQFKADVFGHPLTIGGAYELEPRYVEDRRLDPRRDDDTADVYQDMKLELFYQWSKSLSFFVQSDVYYDPEVYTESGLDQYEAAIKLTQAWLLMHQILDSGFSLQLGRQRMADKRQWWWNDELDSARIYFGEDTLFAELAIAKELGSKQSDQDFIDAVSDRVVRLMGDVIWQWDPKQNLSLFFLS